jgi:hypothetical protein
LGTGRPRLIPRPLPAQTQSIERSPEAGRYREQQPVWEQLHHQHQQQQDRLQQQGAGRFADQPGDGARRRDVRELARECGLTGYLGDSIPDRWVDPHTQSRGGVFETLRNSVHDRAWATLDLNRVKTALVWFRAYLRATNRLPFMPMAHDGDLRAGVYNHETLESFAEYVRLLGSRKAGSRGKALTSDTIAGYSSTIATLRSLEAHYVVTLPAANVRNPRNMKRTRQEQPAGGYRRGLSRGIRAEQLRRVLASRVVDLFTRQGAIDCAAAVLAHNLLLRGGEVCCVEGRPFDPGRDLTFDAIEFRVPCRESRHRPWLTLDVVAVKDTVARARVCPMPVRQRWDASEAICPYGAVCRLWRARLGEEPPARGRISASRAEATWPMFVSPGGTAWHTGDTRALARRFAVVLGIDPADVGAKAFRIGGATDMQAYAGCQKGAKLIKQRGRWSSDVAEVYQRALAGAHLDASAGIGDAEGLELEALVDGWAQPAQFR